MSIFSIIALGLNIVSGIGQNQAARAQAGAAEQTADSMALDRQLRKIQASQEATDRLQNYMEAVSANDAWFAYSGRDPADRSVQAFNKRQEEIVMTELNRGQFQANAEIGRMTLQELSTRASAKNMLAAGRINALGTLASGFMQFHQTMAFDAARMGTKVSGPASAPKYVPPPVRRI